MKRIEKSIFTRWVLGATFFLTALLILNGTFWIFPPGSFGQEWVQVKWVADGDTILLEDGRHVRYIGINAPEIEHENQKAEPLGYAARKFNQTLVLGKPLRLEFDRDKKDRFKRTLAYVFLKDGTFVNKALLEAGYACFLYYKSNRLHSRELLHAQQEAMAQKKGIWKNWHEKPGKFIGNRHSKRFHATNCPFGKKTGKRNRVMFPTSWDAFWDGYAPCKRCLPFGEFITP